MISYKINTASNEEIHDHFSACDDNFLSILKTKVIIDDYLNKIAEHAITFEAWSFDKLIGLVAIYLNTPPEGFITHVSLINHYQNKGIAQQLLKMGKKKAIAKGFTLLALEVDSNNQKAIKLYEKQCFQQIKSNANVVTMRTNLLIRDDHE